MVKNNTLNKFGCIYVGRTLRYISYHQRCRIIFKPLIKTKVYISFLSVLKFNQVKSK